MSLRASLLALGLLVLVFAGCIDSGSKSSDDAPGDHAVALSQPVYDLSTQLEKLNVKVPGHDGKLQDTWVYKPKSNDPDEKFPVFINFSPYWFNLGGDPSTGGDAFSQYMIDTYVARGYAVVLASVRGTGHSEGCFPIGGIKELEDAYAVVDHYAHVEWSNGHVAAGGKSYDGTTIQGLVGYKPHEALKLIFPVSGISDLYRYNYRQGVPYFQGHIFNAYYYAGVGLNEYGEVATEPGLLVDDVACTDMPQVQAHGVASAATGMYNDYWNERDYNRYAAHVDTAFFYVHGFQDWNVKPDHILPWLQNLPAGTVVKAYLHQWEDGGTGHVYPMRDDWNHTMLRVMDHYLKGIDTGILDEPAFHVQDSTGAWRLEKAWPPATTALRLHPQEDGTLATEPGSGTAGTTTPEEAGGTFTYTYEVGPEDLHYAGEPLLHARLATSDPEAAWVAQLYLEHNGTRTWMNEGVLKARLRDSLEEPSPVVPEEMYDYTIRFYPQDDVFPAGSRLVLTLSQGGAAYAYTVDRSATTTIDHQNTHLELPVIDRAAAAWEAPQPKEIDCFTC